MGKKEIYEQKTEQLLMPLLEEYHFELVDVEYIKEAGHYYLRAYIDKEGGITIEDCATVSRRLSDLLDEADYISDSYILEVSSPGLGRQLKKEKDFQRSLLKSVEVKLFHGKNKHKEFLGTLLEFDKDKIVIETEKEERLELKRSEIAFIRLAIDF